MTFTYDGGTAGVQLSEEDQLRLGQDAPLANSPVNRYEPTNIFRSITGQGKPTTVRGAVNSLYNMKPEEIAALQQQLAEAGLIPEEAIIKNDIAWGSSTDKYTEAAWKNLIGIHLRDKRKSVEGHLADRKAANLPQWQILQAKLINGGDGAETDTITVSAPSDIRARADAAAQQLLGRKATAAEKAALVAFVQKGELGAGEAKSKINQANRASAKGGAGPGAVEGGVIDDTTGPKVANEMASRFGLKVTSTVRDAAKNKAVGGAPKSDHLPGDAFAADFGGDPKQLAAFATWARQQQGPGKMFKKVIFGTADHKDHVHVTYNESAGGVPVGGGPAGDDVDRFMSSTRQQESGNRYDWNLTSKSGARGAYQFLPGTWKEAARLAGVDTKDHSPAAQDAAARALMSKYQNEFGDWNLVAIAWHAGPGTARKVKARGGKAGTNDGLINTDDYAQQVVSRMGSVVPTVPQSNMGGVAVTTNFNGETAIAEEIKRKNPVEAAGHDVAGAFGNFVKLLSGPLG